jgi:hypothetical protein
MALTRTVPTGFMADAAFLAAAKVMCARHARPAGSSAFASLDSPATDSRQNSRSSTIPWSVCYKCGAANSHKSPACPVASPVVAQSVRAKVRASIAKAPVAAAQRAELLRICNAYYDKIDRGA